MESNWTSGILRQSDIVDLDIADVIRREQMAKDLNCLLADHHLAFIEADETDDIYADYSRLKDEHARLLMVHGQQGAQKERLKDTVIVLLGLAAALVCVAADLIGRLPA